MGRALATATVLVLLAGAVEAHAAEPRIVYNALGDIHMIGSDGTGAENLTASLAGHALDPEWSPDGKKILFRQSFEPWVMDVDGANAAPVISVTAPDAILGGTWSPDGSRIAFARYNLDTGAGSIKTSKPDGSDEQPVVSELPHDGRLSWSVDGLIAYTVQVGGIAGVRTVPATGGSATTILSNEEDGLRGFHPRWSPSGDEIAFLGCEPDPNCNNDIWTMDADGSDPIRLTDFAGADIGPSWSADGTQIAWARFVSQEAGFRLHTMDADGTDEAEVPNAASVAQFSSWEPLPDKDGDALLDTWEENGIDGNGDGTIDLDLPAMGADADHKDIFVEFDQMGGHSPPSVAFFDPVVDAFANAPVGNPDGVDGIDLHIDFGSNTQMDPDTGETWGSRTRANALLHADLTGGTSAEGKYNWGAFDLIKQLNFDTARHAVFHYAISAHALGGQEAGGISRNSDSSGWHASDFIVTVPEGWFTANTEHTRRVVGGTFMHELGHNLGLRHGGFEDANFKPSYLSIMNYAFAEGLKKEDGTHLLDFSRFDFTLDETALNEATGIGASGAAATFQTLSRCPDGTRSKISVRATPTDWDCDGEQDEELLSLDTNGDEDRGAERGHLDWDHLVFAGGSIGAAASALPDETTPIEPTFEEGRALSELLNGELRPVPVPVGPVPGQGPTGDLGPGGTNLTPILSGLRVRPTRPRPRITYALTVAAEVTFRVQRRKGARWGAVKGRFTHAGATGANALRMPKAVAKRLRRGRHRLTASPAGGKAVSRAFRMGR